MQSLGGSRARRRKFARMRPGQIDHEQEEGGGDGGENRYKLVVPDDVGLLQCSEVNSESESSSFCKI